MLVRPALVFMVLCGPLQAGSTLRVQGRDFSLSLTQPEGWTADFESVGQIANFVLYPQAANWRDAEVVVFARVLPRGRDGSLEAFMEEDQKQFAGQCPYYESTPLELNIRGERRFLVRRFDCPGVREEILAVTEVPGYLAAFVLTSGSGGGLENALSPLEEILSSFAWERRDAERPEFRQAPSNHPHPPGPAREPDESGP